MTAEDAIFQKFRGKRVLVDTNLLLLYMIGSFQRLRIESFKRTNMFSVEDFDTLVAILAEFKVLVTTPHLLTEVNSLANALPEYLKSSWCEHFAMQTERFHEVLDPAVSIMKQATFNPFGLADAAIHCASVDTLVLTEDFRLSGFLSSQGIQTLNFRDVTSSIRLT